MAAVKSPRMSGAITGSPKSPVFILNQLNPTKNTSPTGNDDNYIEDEDEDFNPDDYESSEHYDDDDYDPDEVFTDDWSPISISGLSPRAKAQQAAEALRLSKLVYNPLRPSMAYQADAEGVALGVVPDLDGRRWRERRMRMARYVQLYDAAADADVGAYANGEDVPAPLARYLDLAFERESGAAGKAVRVKGGLGTVGLEAFVGARPAPRGVELRKRRDGKAGDGDEVMGETTQEHKGDQQEAEESQPFRPSRGRFAWEEDGAGEGGKAVKPGTDAVPSGPTTTTTPIKVDSAATSASVASSRVSPSAKALGKRPAVGNHNEKKPDDPFRKVKRESLIVKRRAGTPGRTVKSPPNLELDRRDLPIRGSTSTLRGPGASSKVAGTGRVLRSMSRRLR